MAHDQGGIRLLLSRTSHGSNSRPKALISIEDAEGEVVDHNYTNALASIWNWPGSAASPDLHS
jgi:hypothetical protein